MREFASVCQTSFQWFVDTKSKTKNNTKLNNNLCIKPSLRVSFKCTSCYSNFQHPAVNVYCF